MEVITTHILTCTMHAPSSDVMDIAGSFLSRAAVVAGVEARSEPAPLPDGAKPESRTRHVRITCEDHDVLQKFFVTFDAAMIALGVAVE